MSLQKTIKLLQVALVGALALALGACDADSPTAPVQTPNPPPPSGATTAFAITVSLSPRTFELGSDTVISVTVTARRTDTNQPVPRGSTAVLTTTNGILSGVGNTVAVTFDANGTAVASLTGVTAEAVVRAQIEQSFGQATLRVTEAPLADPFTITGLSPNFGPPSGGTEVRIQGSGFSLPITVVFGGNEVPVLSASSSQVRIRTPPTDLPAGQNRSVAVTVNINVGEAESASDTVASAFTYTRNESPVVPKIISVTPTSGPNEGGTPVTIFGEAFGSEVQVFFGEGSRIEAKILDVSPTRILVETPAATGQNADNRNSTVSIRVVDLVSGFVASMGSAFQFGGGDMFISSVAPTEGTYFGGTLVTIFGQGFEAPVAVEFGGEAQQPVSVSGTEIVARAVGPIEIANCARPSGSFRVVNIETNEIFTAALSYTYRPVEPRIGSISADSTRANVLSGAILLGSPTEIIMTGSGFDRQSFPPSVDFGTVRSPSVVITSLDPTVLHEGFGVGDVMEIAIPPAPVPWPEAACTAGGTQGMRYVDQVVNLVVTARDTGCSDSVSFTYEPSDSTCRLDPPDPVAPVAQFSFSIAGTVVTFTDLSSNAPTSLQWDFGDGAVENGNPGENRVHDYGAGASGMSFNVQLTATNGGGTGQITKTVNIP